MTKDLTKGSHMRLILSFGIPVLFGYLFQQLYNMGVEIEENSELDLLAAYNKHANDERIPAKIAEMEAELGGNNPYGGILPRLAQYGLTLLDWAEEHKCTRQYVAFANKCWPAFKTEFRFVPCYVNSRLAARGIPVSCEVDIYGALSEYIGVCVSGAPTTLLDINNSVQAQMWEEQIEGIMPMAAIFSYWSARAVLAWIITGRRAILSGLSEASRAASYTRSSWSAAASPLQLHKSWWFESMAIFAKAAASSSVIVP